MVSMSRTSPAGTASLRLLADGDLVTFVQWSAA